MVAQFTMDMIKATAPSNPNDEMPELGSKTEGASAQADVTTTKNYYNAGHAVLSILALVCLLPMDSILRMCVKSIKLHTYMVVMIGVLFVVGMGLGFKISSQYQRVCIVVEVKTERIERLTRLC